VIIGQSPTAPDSFLPGMGYPIGAERLSGNRPVTQMLFIARNQSPLSIRLARSVIAVLLTLLAFGQFFASVSATNPPVYPDLVPLPAANLHFERTPDGHYLLRFDSTTANYGGPLEIAVKSLQDKTIYQDLYDAKLGGKIVAKVLVGADLIYHPTHNHFHFQGFGEYQLLKRDKAGVYRETSRLGEKTSFCILDLMRVKSGGPPSRYYGGCGATLQGLSSGWADIYIASLTGQWIDVGSAVLPDGAYAIRTTSDPLDKLLEQRDFNNVDITYFSVANGRVNGIDTTPPLCSVRTAYSSQAGPASQVGSTVELDCSGFAAGEAVNLYWGSLNTTARATVTASSTGTIAAPFVIPNADAGVHYILARGNTSATQAATFVNVVPSLSLQPSSGPTGTTVGLLLRGYSSGETVDIGYYKTATQRVSLTSIATSSSGTGAGSVVIPASVFGKHVVDGKGLSSNQTASTNYGVEPGLTFDTDTVEPGDDVGLQLRGFAANELGGITIPSASLNLGNVTASHSGSTRTSIARVTIPASLSPGDYVVRAIGQTSVGQTQATLHVVAHTGSDDPTDTPTATETTPPEVTATATPSESPSPEDVTATPTETAVETVTPTETAEPVLPTDTPSITETATPGQTVSATETATVPATATETSTPTPPSDP
jgi:hypothetical protein